MTTIYVYIFAYVLVYDNLFYFPKADVHGLPIIRVKRDETMEMRKTSEQHPLMDFDEQKLYDGAVGEDLHVEFQSK
jgi:hypothetical protein